MRSWPAYLKWRDGRPRWEPGPKLRRLGWKGQDFKNATGAWFDKGAAVTAAEAINAKVEAAQTANGGRVSPTPKAKTIHPRSCQALYNAWTATPEYEMLSKGTRDDYESKARAFLNTIVVEETEEGSTPRRGDKGFAEIHVGAIARRHMKGLWRELYRTRGHHMANGVMRIVSIMMTFAVDEDWIKISPAAKLKLKQAPPRLVLWLPDELALIVATADELGLPSVGDAIVAALHSGQRQGDVLAMPERIFDEVRIRLSQLKTNAKIDAPMTPAMLARVAAARARRSDTKVIDLERKLILRDRDGGEYDRHYFGKMFRKVRDAAAQKRQTHGNQALVCPNIADKNFQDLRDTAVTRLALAGCTLPEIAAITGHDLESITRIIKHYLVLQPAMADAAIGKLNAWLAKEGIAI